MTDLHLRTIPVEPMPHPGAHRTGIALIDQSIRGSYYWDAATPKQRQLLTTALKQTVTHEDGSVTRPEIAAGPRTLASMRAKGLVDDDGRVSVWGVIAARSGRMKAEYKAKRGAA